MLTSLAHSSKMRKLVFKYTNIISMLRYFVVNNLIKKIVVPPLHCEVVLFILNGENMATGGGCRLKWTFVWILGFHPLLGLYIVTAGLILLSDIINAVLDYTQHSIYICRLDSVASFILIIAGH